MQKRRTVKYHKDYMQRVWHTCHFDKTFKNYENVIMQIMLMKFEWHLFNLVLKIC